MDFRSDIYSLGLVMFELLSLTKAREKWTADILEAAQCGEVDWEALPDDLDPKLMAILRRMLGDKPEDCYPDTSAAAIELEYYIYHEGYGPTVVTLEKYLRENFPYLYTGDVDVEERPTPSQMQYTRPISESQFATTRNKPR